MTRWEATDADFTFAQLAETIAWLIESGADFDPLATEDLFDLINKEGESS